MRRSPESTTSYGVAPSLPESSVSPLPMATGTGRRTSVHGASGGGGGGYVSPDYPKPSTPYEDKVIPTLRNRNRSEGGHLQGSLMASTDAGGPPNDETESIAGTGNMALTDDATAELNQAEMIEANQIMIVFDKQLVSSCSAYERDRPLSSIIGW